MFCPECGAEYVEGFSICADCGVQLVPELPPESAPEPESTPEYVGYEEILVVNPGDVALIKSILDSEKINHFFKGEFVTYGNSARLMVRKDQVDEAMDALKSVESITDLKNLEDVKEWENLEGTKEDLMPLALDGTQPVFFPVSALKLVVMSIVTFNLYLLYWFYQNWKLVKGRTGGVLSPFWRAFLSIIYCYRLFTEIRETATSRGIRATASFGMAAIDYIALLLCWWLPEPYSLISLLAGVVLLPVQTTVNNLNRELAPNHKPNNNFSGWNIAVIVVGGLLFLMVFIYTLTSSSVWCILPHGWR